MTHVEGPLPKSANLTTGGGTVLLTVAGSGYTPVSGWVQIYTFVDNVFFGACQVFANAANSHTACVANQMVITGLAAGNHTVRLEAFACSTDAFDRFNVTAIELPF